MDSLDCLVIAPHPDDAELGAGGSIIKMLAAGWRVGIVDLTDGEPTPFGSVEVRAAETSAATKILGVTCRYNLGLKNRELTADLESRKKLANLMRQLRPRWLFAPYWIDAHPDHVAATELVEAARFWAKLTKSSLDGEPWHPQRVFYYYCIHLRQHPQPAFVVDISAEWPRKKEAILAYRSQFVTGRDLQRPVIDKLEVEARWWGQSIGVDYGEPFASREPIGLATWSALV